MEWWVRKKTISSKKTEKAANHCFAAFLIYHLEFVDHWFCNPTVSSLVFNLLFKTSQHHACCCEVYVLK